MEGICGVCQNLMEVQEMVSAKSFMVLLTGSKDCKLLVCEECKPLVVKAIKQALTMVNKII